MCIQICIDLIRFVLINLISKNFLYGCLLFQQSNFLLAALAGASIEIVLITTSDLDISL